MPGWPRAIAVSWDLLILDHARMRNFEAWEEGRARRRRRGVSNTSREASPGENDTLPAARPDRRGRPSVFGPKAARSHTDGRRKTAWGGRIDRSSHPGQ